MKLVSMKEKMPIPEISPLVRHWMPEADEDELKEATSNLRGFLTIVHRIFLRLEAEGRLPVVCDNSSINGRVEEPNENQI
ncbi:MAG: hypothetical protein ACSLFB_03175 [Acidimicrobiales bacterium]